MKILITVGIYPPDIGGPASFVPKIAKMLTENKHDVTVICLSDNKVSDDENYNERDILYKILFTKRILKNFKYLRIFILHHWIMTPG